MCILLVSSRSPSINNREIFRKPLTLKIKSKIKEPGFAEMERCGEKTQPVTCDLNLQRTAFPNAEVKNVIKV